MAKQLENVEPAYAAHKVSEIDTELAQIAARKKQLTETRKLYAPHLPKRATASAND
jgi:hypothetical protein